MGSHSSRAVLLALFLGLVSGVSMRAGSAPSMTDSRLARTIQLHIATAQLGELLPQIRQQTGVSLSAAEPMSDTVLTCRYVGSLKSFMDAQSALLGADRIHPALWSRSGSGTAPHYRLERDLATTSRIQAMRQERESWLLNRMSLLSRSLHFSASDWARLSKEDPGCAKGLKAALELYGPNRVLQQIASFPAEEQRALLLGGQVRYRVAQLAGRQSSVDYLKHLLGDTYGFSGQTMVTYFSVGAGPFQRVIHTRFGDDPGHPNGDLGVCLGTIDLFPELAGPRLQEEWRQAFGDPAPRSRATVEFHRKGEGPRGITRRSDLFLRVAEAAGVNLIADDMAQPASDAWLPEAGKLTEVLDRICTPQIRPVQTGDTEGSFWRKRGGTYLVRSLSWPEDELVLIPHRWLSAWGASEARHGHLTLQDLMEMAALNSRQLTQLATWFPQVKELEPLQAPLRWFARANPSVRARLQQQMGVSLAELGINLGTAWRDMSPSADRPPYLWMLFQHQPQDIHLTLGEGQHTLPQHSAEPIVGAVFHYPKAPSVTPTVLVVHLKRG
jgi:hypothetical protein